MFFPDTGQKGKSKLIIEAQKICMTCPVFRDCAQYRERTGSEYGVWAGVFYTPKD